MLVKGAPGRQWPNIGCDSIPGTLMVALKTPPVMGLKAKGS